ncbi:MAG TPA: ribonuclease P protein component [Paracoccaceae bacterium]|nr:ribonuclease P protein component [Paracoccaceae bacterium]
MQILQKRSDFVVASRARRQAMQGLLLQARRRDPSECDPQIIRVGYTCSKKVGNAVARNRAKRRLREVARAILPAQGKPGWDYVLIGRAVETGQRPFHLLLEDLETALQRIHAPRKPRT